MDGSAQASDQSQYVGVSQMEIQSVSEASPKFPDAANGHANWRWSHRSTSINSAFNLVIVRDGDYYIIGFQGVRPAGELQPFSAVSCRVFS